MAQVEIIELFPPAKPVDLNGLIDNDPPIQEAISIHILSNARVNYFGYVFYNGKAYEHFISPRHRGTITRKTVLASLFLKKKIRVNHPVISVAHGWYDNYYHFTLEVLIKIFLLSERYSETPVVFPKKLSSFHKQWFELLGINNLLFIEENEIVVSPKVISCNFPERDLNHHPIITPLFREWILNKIQDSGILDRAKFNPRLFIDRQKADYRKVLNHDEIISNFNQSKVQVINFEDLNLKDQINAMFFASDLYFVHGAGLTNILFCKPETKIIDFCHKDFNQWCFLKLSQTLDLNYQLTPCEGNSVHELPGYCDLYVPLTAITKSIDGKNFSNRSNF